MTVAPSGEAISARLKEQSWTDFASHNVIVKDGEVHLWGLVRSEDERKALIVLGHIPSEQAGMDECARWLKTFVTEVPVEFIPAKEPFWAPK